VTVAVSLGRTSPSWAPCGRWAGLKTTVVETEGREQPGVSRFCSLWAFAKAWLHEEIEGG
jgi:hypothetical protein